LFRGDPVALSGIVSRPNAHRKLGSVYPKIKL
jgi:hypothetical protein